MTLHTRPCRWYRRLSRRWEPIHTQPLAWWWQLIPALRRDQWRRSWRRRLAVTPLEVALLLVLGGILYEVVTLTD